MRGGTGLGFGAAMIVGGMAMIGFTDNFVRVIAEDAGLWQFQLFRSAMALPLLAAAAIRGPRGACRRDGCGLTPAGCDSARR